MTETTPTTPATAGGSTTNNNDTSGGANNNNSNSNRSDNNSSGVNNRGRNNDNRGNNRGRNNDNPNNSTRNHLTTINNDHLNFQGACPDIDSVLGMPNEKITAKESYDVFTEKLATYVTSTFKHGSDVVCAIRELVHPKKSFEKKYLPNDPDEKELEASRAKRFLFETKIKLYCQREQDMMSSLDRIFALVWGQCSQGLTSALKHTKDFQGKQDSCDVIWLLQQVKELTSGIDYKTNKYFRYQQAMLKFWTIKQGQYESTDAFFTRFNSTYQTLEFAGGADSLFSNDLFESTGVPADDKVEEKACVERVKAMCLIQRSDLNRYSELVTELKNASYVGNDEYPTTTADAYDLLLRRCNTVPTNPRGRGRGNGLQFTQTEGGEATMMSRLQVAMAPFSLTSAVSDVKNVVTFAPIVQKLLKLVCSNFDTILHSPIITM